MTWRGLKTLRHISVSILAECPRCLFRRQWARTSCCLYANLCTPLHGRATTCFVLETSSMQLSPAVVTSATEQACVAVLVSCRTCEST